MSEGIERFSKRSRYLILLLLTVLNVIFRIPTIPNERGIDSFKIHSYANLISADGFANWIVHPLSIFGMYPFSTPVAVPFFQSGISQSADLSMKYAILITSILIGLIGMITSYMMAKEIKNDDMFAFLVAFCFSLSPLFLSYTIWTTSTRNLFVALVPVFIWGLLKFYNTPQDRWKYAILAVISFVLLGMIHHLVLLLIPIVVSYFICLIFKYVKIELYISNNHISLTTLYKSYIYILIYTFFIAIQGFRLFVYKNLNIWWQYQSGTFFHGNDVLTLVGNMIIDYASSVGILSIFAIIGLLPILVNSNRDISQNFILITLLVFSPIMMWGTYTPLVLLSFFCMLIAYGILYLKDVKFIKKYNIRLITLCILVSIIFSVFMLWKWDISFNNQDFSYLNHSTEYTGTYLKNYHTNDSSFVTNSDERKISAVSQIPFPPPDTVYIFNLLNESDLKINSSISLSSISHLDNPDSIFKSNVDFLAEYRGQSYDVDSDVRKKYDLKYNIRYVIQDNKRLGNSFTGRPDLFYSSVIEKKSKIYDNNELSVWYLGGT
jgi:hypothetical protein